MTPRRAIYPWRRALVLLLAGTALVAAGAGGWAGYLRLTGNIHELDPGRAYRSGQLWPGQLERLVADKGIRTVVNLRGDNPGQAWYDDEVQAAARAGARLVSLPMSANAEPDAALLDRLMSVIRTAEGPLLIHCEAGADRTGLASALYRLIRNGDSPEVADRQLSFRYGHFPWLTSRTGAMDRTFWRVVRARQAAPAGAQSP